MRVILQLLTPAKYLTIRATTYDKIWVDWVFPALAALVVTYAWVRWPAVVPLAGKSGLIESIGALMQVLVGFYVAALAAVATFTGSSLDENVIGMTMDGKPLRRRLLLSYLFGYLALLSLALYVLMLFKGVPVAAAQHVIAPVGLAIKYVAAFIYQFIFWQMIFVTLFGLFYLTDRIHRSD